MTSSIVSSWQRIVAWLETQIPEETGKFQPGVSKAALDDFAGKVGLELPDDFVALYQAVNGSDANDAEVGVYPSTDEWDQMCFCPMELSSLLQDWEMQKELLEGGDFDDVEPENTDDGVAEDWWNVGWIPFAWNGGGDYLCIDLAPTPSGTRGQVITHSHETGDHRILAPSLSAYLNDVATAFEANLFEYNEDYGPVKKEEAE